MAPLLAFLRDFGAFLSARKRYWLLPTALLLLAMALLVALTQGSSVAPAIYAPR